MPKNIRRFIAAAVLAAIALGLPAAAFGKNPNVVRIDPKTGKQEVLAGGAPWLGLAGIAVGAKGAVYVSNNNGRERSDITSLTAPSFAIKRFTAPVEGETAALVASGTSLYELASGWVRRHDLVAPFASESLFEGRFETLNQVRFGAISGTTLYMTTYDAGCDSVEGGNGAPLFAVDTVARAGRVVNGRIGCDEPTGIAAAPDGTLFVAVRTEKGAVQIVKVDPAAGKRTTVSQGRLLKAPQGLALTKAGDIVVADAESGVLRVSPRNGKQTRVASGPALGDVVVDRRADERMHERHRRLGGEDLGTDQLTGSRRRGGVVEVGELGHQRQRGGVAQDSRRASDRRRVAAQAADPHQHGA